MGFPKNELPVLELKLKSENQELFTMFLRPVVETGYYPVLNVLPIAKQIPALSKSRFNSLEIITKDSLVWPQNASLKILITMEEE